MDLSWRSEGIWLMLWAIKKIKQLELPTTQCSVKKILNKLPDFLTSTTEFANEAEDEFIKPVHVLHLPQDRPIVLKYLGLPAGWRFQIDDNGYEDIWFDETILKT